jgi:hypothetical protein
LAQGVSDWFAPPSYAGESADVDPNHPFHLYGFRFALNPAKTVKNIPPPTTATTRSRR